MMNAALMTIAIGVGATLLMDAWNLLLKRAFGMPSLSYCLLGRWFLHMRDGTFTHASIAKAGQKKNECTSGRIAHYAIGIGMALAFVAIVSRKWLAAPTIAPALAFGAVTVVFPYFVMQPSFGLGVASSRTASPMRARVKSLGTHIVYGAGLYLFARTLEWATQ